MSSSLRLVWKDVDTEDKVKALQRKVPSKGSAEDIPSIQKLGEPATGLASDENEIPVRPRIETPKADDAIKSAEAPGKEALAGVQGDTVKGLGPIPTPTSVTCTVTVSNKTTRTLKLDSSSANPESGVFDIKPKDINPGQSAKIKARSSEPISFNGVEFTVKYFLDDEKKTVWPIHFKVPPSVEVTIPILGTTKKKTKPNASDAIPVGPKKDDFNAEQPDIDANADDVTADISISPAGGPVPTPTVGPTPTAGPQPQQNVTCIITIKNDTKVALKLADQDNEQGEFSILPPPSIPAGPGASVQFGYTTTKGKPGCRGSVTYEVGSPSTATWRCEWDNPVQEKNTAKGTLIPQSAGFESLAQPGQGDENVPFTFTISGGGAGPVVPTIGPTIIPTIIPTITPTITPTPEPVFAPPPESKQPTLRLGMQSADGWVEYLQERLNKRLQPSPNLKVNGVFDKTVEKAVRAYQTQEKLQVDGVAGNQTWASLRLADPEPVGTDGRPKGTFVEKGSEARWFSEGPASFSKSKDQLQLGAVSVGTETELEGVKVNIFITPPGGQRKGLTLKLGPALVKSDTGQGNQHFVFIENFTKTFPSTPPGAQIEAYIIEGFFEQELGGDFFTTKKVPVLVNP
jgi:hypothetical protein